MISQSQNRVRAIKSKFENLNTEAEPLIVRKKSVNIQLSKQNDTISQNNESASLGKESYSKTNNVENGGEKSDTESDSSTEWSPKPNSSYLYNKSEVRRSASNTKKSLTRQTSDPGKKLHRSHAFRCDRSQKIGQGPKRHGSCNGRSETSDFSLKMGERKLSKDRLKKLGNLLEDQMRKENFVPPGSVTESPVKVLNSVPDSEVPRHILDQYAKVFKNKKRDPDKQDAMTDSGVSSETENLEEEKVGKIKKLRSQFENNEKVPDVIINKNHLGVTNDLTASSDTIKLERKNPHMTLTDTLKKALKQPLPVGPPPKKPPRTFAVTTIQESPEKPKKDTKQMLEKLEQVLQQREASTSTIEKPNHIYDVAETDLTLTKPKEIHYLCTEILDIAHKTLLPNQNPLSNCFNSLNCAIVTNNSMSSLPYTRFSTGSNSNRNSLKQCCSCSSESLDSDSRRRLSTFFDDKPIGKCLKCQGNEEKENSFKCHLNCKCKETNSEFFVEKEHIYDVPFVGDDENVKSERLYGTLNKIKASKSMENLAVQTLQDEIYDIPSEISRPASPATESDFKRLRNSFEQGFQTSRSLDKPLKTPKPIMVSSKSIENLPKILKLGSEGKKPLENFHTQNHRNLKFGSEVKKSMDNLPEVTKGRKFSTEVKKCRRFEKSDVKIAFTLPKKDQQLDTDRENLNRLMTEIYDAVASACAMDNKPESFPTDTADASSDDSTKLTRTLTEKRKNYVRRVSSRVAYLETKHIKATRQRHKTTVCSYKPDSNLNPYSTFRSWKSFRASQSNLAKDAMAAADVNLTAVNVTGVKVTDVNVTDGPEDSLSIDEKAGCVDMPLPFVPRENGLFNVCLLVGLNHMTGQAYVKSVFPEQVQVPPHIENLIFPETLSPSSNSYVVDAQYTQNYSLVLTDERGERAYGYCRRVLPEGATTCLPLCYCIIGKYRAPGFYYKILQEIESHHGSSETEINSILQQLFESDFPAPGKEITIQYTDKQTDRQTKSKTMPDWRRNRNDEKDEQVSKFYDAENNNGPKKVFLSFQGPRSKIIKQSIDPRVDEDCISTLLDSLGSGLLIKVFGSLLLERKILVVGDKLSTISSCIEGLQSILYPFVWQQPLISSVPGEIQLDVLQAPLPILAGMLNGNAETEFQGIGLDEGMLIDLSHPSKVLHLQGDETTILPTSSFKALKSALQMESLKNKDRPDDGKTRNLLISEAFLRFFVDILGDFWKYLSVGVMKEGDLGKGDVVFDKESYLKSIPSKQNTFFLEWFVETAMFNHFMQNMAALYHNRQTDRHTHIHLVDTPQMAFYELFEERFRSKSKGSGNGDKRSAVNKKMRLLKMKLRELVA